MPVIVSSPPKKLECLGSAFLLIEFYSTNYIDINFLRGLDIVLFVIPIRDKCIDNYYVVIKIYHQGEYT